MRRRGLLAPEAVWQGRDTLADAAIWDVRHISPIDERIADRKVQILTAGWPFTDHVPIVPPVPAGDTLGLIAEEVTRGRSDLLQAHKDALAYNLLRLDSASAEQEYRILTSLDPTDLQMRLQYAHFLLVRGKTAEMRRELTASLSLIPTLLAHRALADLDRQERNYSGAIEHYRAVLGFEQTTRERSEHAYLLGLTFAMQGRRDSALVRVTESSRLAPGFAPAQEALRHLMPK
jgi:tetratricopeptide (TPR) repeat protein